MKSMLCAALVALRVAFCVSRVVKFTPSNPRCTVLYRTRMDYQVVFVAKDFLLILHHVARHL